MSAIDYNTAGVGNSNNHQNQHNHAAMLAANPAANLLCNYCPPAAKRKKPNHAGEILQAVTDGRAPQARIITNATGLAGTAVPISLTPVTNALIRQDTRFNADEFDPVKIFGELTTGQTGVLGPDCGFGATLLGPSNLLDHTTRILSFAAEGNRIEETLEIKRNAVTATKTFVTTAPVTQHSNNREETAHSSKKTARGSSNPKPKKAPKGSKSKATNNSADLSKSSNSGPSPRRKLKSMSIEEKYYVLQRLLKPDVSQATICEEMQLNKSVVSRIWCDRFKIEELYKQGSGNRIKVKYMHNGPAHPKKRGHGKKAKALAKAAAAAAASNSNTIKTETTTTSNAASTSTVVTTPTSAAVNYHQTLQTLQQPTFARPTLLGLYTASTDTLNNIHVTARSYEPNNVQH